MKLFRLLTTTAITTMAVAAMAVSASAMTAEYSYDADKGIGTVALDGIPAVTDGNQVTMLVLNNDVFGDFADAAVENASVSEGDIVQIDQADSISSAVVGDLVAALDAENAVEGATYQASKTYYVRVGVNGGIETAQFTVNATAQEPETPVYTLGDVNADGVINISDVLIALDAYLGTVTLDDVQKLAADVSPKGAPDGVINISDVLLILDAYLGTATL